VLALTRDALRLISTLGHRESVLATAGPEGLARSAAPRLPVGTSGELRQYTSAPRGPSKFSQNRPATRFAISGSSPGFSCCHRHRFAGRRKT
jgi:hypothetical protein